MTVKAQHDCELRCNVCGRESKANFASSLRDGWEECCGYTMSLVSTSADVGDATRQALGCAPGFVRRALEATRGGGAGS
jgi:hypothetical protein